eukprot:115083-Karenia_brevis.AAC.1
MGTSALLESKHLRHRGSRLEFRFDRADKDFATPCCLVTLRKTCYAYPSGKDVKPPQLWTMLSSRRRIPEPVVGRRCQISQPTIGI